MRFLTSEIAACVRGTLVGPDVEVDEARHDSRDVVGGELFVPVKGLRDGHDFVRAALDAGAAAYLTAREPVGGTAVVVDDPEGALRDLALAARRRLPHRVVGITGSVGKTSAKDLTAAVLGRQWLTSASLRSFNNELGVPLTLINAADGTEALVVEMGARGHGHIADLCAVAQPTVGIVTAVELVHAEMFGDLASVARAKAELIESLPESGTAVLNGGNPWVAGMAEHTRAEVLTFGAHHADVRAEDVFIDRDLRPSFRLCTPWGDTQVLLRVRGVHQVGNALAGAAAGLACDVELADVAAGLAEAELSPWRMELHAARSGAVIINDAYNAGPASVEAALRSLVHLEARRHLAVLGPMAELGHHGPEAHRAIGELTTELGIDAVSIDAPDYGLFDVADVDAALAHLGELGEGDALLVKGSRVAGLERLVHRLLEG